LLAATLCAQYEVSSGVLREVLTRLVGDGLATSEPQRGFRVVSVSETDLRHLTESRVLIESELVRQSIAHGDLTFESTLTAAHHTLTRTPIADLDGRVREEWLVVHRAFHHALLAGAPNARLLGIADTLRDAAEVYRCWSRTVAGDSGRDLACEHRALMGAVLERDADRAASLLAEHIERGTEVLLMRRPSETAPVARDASCR
jgi:DNA-binding GntR family transcriptional regulator